MCAAGCGRRPKSKRARYCSSPDCERDRRNSRGRARGERPRGPAAEARHRVRYSSHHRAERKRWRPQVEAGVVRCARCGQAIRRGQAWDLGHVDGGGPTDYSGPEHARATDCAAGGNRATAKHAADKKRAPRHSREW